MNSEPEISVVLPFFNGKEYINETIESIRQQTYRNFEVIVVDDGSTNTDHSKYLIDLIDSLHDARFKYSHKPNGGLSNARNHGIGLSSAPWIAFIDQDDVWNETKLEQQVAVFNNAKGVNFVFTDGKYIGDVQADMLIASKNNLTEGLVSETYTRLLKGNFIICSSVLFRKSFAVKVGPSNPCFKICPDYEFIIRFAEQTDFHFVADAAVSYRIHGSNTVKNRLKLAAEVILLLCDRKMETKKQKLFATYNLIQNIGTFCGYWLRK